MNFLCGEFVPNKSHSHEYWGKLLQILIILYLRLRITLIGNKSIIKFHEIRILILLDLKIIFSTCMMLRSYSNLRLRAMTHLLKVRFPVLVFHWNVRLHLIIVHQNIRWLLLVMYRFRLTLEITLLAVHVALFSFEVWWIWGKSSIH